MAILDNGEIDIKEIYPEDFGIQRTREELVKASSDIDENVQIAVDVLKGKKGTETEKARLDLCLINAGAILFITGVVNNLPDGVKIAREAVESGAALKKLYEFAENC